MRRLSRRLFLAQGAAGASALLLATCAGQPPTPTPAPVKPAAPAPAPTATPAAAPAAKPPATGEVTITLWSWFNKPFTALMPKWNAKNPRVKVNLVDMSGEIHQKVLTALTAGSGAPDITGSQDYNLPILADTGGLADISRHIAPYRDKIVPYKLNNGSYKGKVYSVPWDGSPSGLYHRRDVFEQYKIDPEKIETYDDYVAVGKKLKDASGGKVKLFNIAKEAWSPLVNLTWQQGGGIYAADSGKVIIDDDRAVRTLTLIKRLWDEGVVHQNIGGEATNATYKDATTAAPPGAIWLANGIVGNAPETSGKWGVNPLPAFEKGGTRTTAFGGSQLAVPGQGKLVDEAFSFLEFTQLSQEGSTIMWTDGNLFPVLKDAVNWSILNEPVAFYGGQKALKLYAELNSQIPPYTYGKGFLEASRIVGSAVTFALDGKKSPKEALADAAKEIRQKQGLD
ncbi:MAG: sugar ABC transporter substrate-binding protein [Chloroflexi bacterium]|nr:sugar ABC transporter substrate-binding protein [Chloroflexota bacterium]